MSVQAASASGYASAAAIRRDVARLMRPPVRMRVSEAAEKYARIRTASGGVSPWSADLVPYLVEPMDLLTSRRFDAVVFVGPARTGKTQGLIDCWVAYMVTCDPCDMQIINTSMETVRDYSRMRIDRLIRQSPALRAELSGGARNATTYDKTFRSGVVLKLSWPSVSQLSGRDIRFMALTDYDRMTENVDGEGSPYALASKRTQTFLSRGMTLVDSSPGYDVTDPTWSPRTPHEAPPARGSLSLFNAGDRRRLYWPCQACGEWWMQPPGIAGFSFAHERDLLGFTVTDLRSPVGVPCPHCGNVHEQAHKRAMVAAARWVPEGCRIEGGELVGEPRRSNIASFWLPGAAAAFQSWESIVVKYLQAVYEYETTGSEESLRTRTNTDLGAPYLPKARQTSRDAKALAARAEPTPKRQVPPGVRFLVTAVDVQGARFVVQVHGVGVGGELWLVDRYDIHWSARRDDRGQPLPLAPAAHLEDWGVLTDHVIRATYPLGDGTGRRMAVALAGCDSGGKAGVTSRAYDYWRTVRRQRLDGRFKLLKGERRSPGVRSASVIESYPDSQRKDRHAGARGEVPVYLLDTTALKDAVDADLKRESPGPGFVHLPDWLERGFYDELAAETRTDKGWDTVKAGAPNEAFDLLAYAKALCIVLGVPRVDWDRPPPWAAPWESNSLVGAEEDVRPEPNRAASVWGNLKR